MNATTSEPLLQISAGAQHVLALSKSGNVITWSAFLSHLLYHIFTNPFTKFYFLFFPRGGNRKGQLGDGQLTSSCVPQSILQLRHRPVISIACGESHSMVLTVGGSVYAWGETTNGQLGTGDTTHRLRPELIRSLRAAKARQISAGKQHSMVISSRGLLFAFGSNAHGQLGLGNADLRFQPMPTVVERLREFKAIDVCCGSAHTLVLCSGDLLPRPKVYAMGLNSSGQVHSTTVPHDSLSVFII